MPYENTGKACNTVSLHSDLTSIRYRTGSYYIHGSPLADGIPELKAIIQTSAGNEMSQCLSVAMGSIEMSLSNNRMVAETMARGVEAVQRQAVKGSRPRQIGMRQPIRKF